MEFTLNPATQLKQLAELKTAMINGGNIRLFQNDLDPTPSTVLGDLTEATYTGYAMIAVAAWNAGYTEPTTGRGTIVTPLAQFQPTGSAVTNLIYGWYYTDADGDLVCCGRLSGAPIAMAGVGDAIPLFVKLQLGGA